MSLRSQKIISIAQDLVQEGSISPHKLDLDSEFLKTPGKDLGEILVERGYLTEQQLNERLAKKAGIKAISLEKFELDFQAIKLLQPGQALKWRMLPVGENRGRLTIATADPFDLGTLDEARNELSRELECVLIAKRELDEALKKYYGAPQAATPKPKPIPPMAARTEQQQDREAPANPPARKPLDRDGQVSEIVTIVDQIYHDAVHMRASDVHLEPTRDALKARFRVDGVLELYKMFPQSKQQSILSRIKIMGGMDVAEQRVPQDGRTTLKIEDKNLDVRIATYPSMFGEAAAIRLLTKSLITLDDLGFREKERDNLEKIIHNPHGIFLVTGPTGSGKTTTLYAALQQVDRMKHHVLSVEDPVENEIDGVAQTQINTKAGLTFPVALRSMLRQDPDVILVGEIRDQETADIALRAAMTGHLVISTLHTNDAIGSIGRLIDLGIETYLISSTMLGVVAQRLVRRICQGCKEPAVVTPQHLRSLGPKAEGLTAFKGKGCGECNNRGYSGRVGIYELVYIDDELRVLINNRAPEVRLKEKAAAAGSSTMREDGIDKIRRGITTIDEVLKVCGDHV